MQTTDIEWKTIGPPAPLTDFVESFWLITNHTGHDHQVVIIPDGRFDIIFSLQGDGELEIILMGLDTQPEQAIIPAHTTFCAVSLNCWLLNLDALQLSDSLTSGEFSSVQAAIANYEKQMFERFADIGAGTMFNTQWMHEPNALNDMLEMFGKGS